MISERIKHNSYNNRFAQLYFWRTHDQSEIDLVEEEDGELRAFEFKWNPAKKSRMPKSFANAYGNIEYNVVTPQNHWNFVLPNK